MARDKLLVIDGDQKVPFLRGMLTHSLIARGLRFQDAYEIATEVRQHLRSHGTVKKKTLDKLINKVLEERFGGELAESYRATIVQPPTILVHGEQSTMPFSKGILSTSLQAAGLAPFDSYETAREIERQLLLSESHRISRDELRRSVYETVLRKHGPETAERYLLWRWFEVPDRPVVLLLGGSTGVGKTTVSTEVAHRLGIFKTVSTDVIRQVMRLMLSKDLLPTLHRSSFDAWRELIGANEQDRGGAVIEAFKEQARLVLVGVKAMVERARQENTSIIVDGVHLVPGLLDLSDFKESVYVLPLVLSTLSREKYLERFPQRQRGAENRIARKYLQNFENIMQIQDYVLDMAEAHEVPIVENTDLDQTVASILIVLSNSLREKSQLSSEDLTRRMLRQKTSG